VSLLGRTSLWGLTLATSPAGVFVLHSNQQLDSVYNNNKPLPDEAKSERGFSM
jgi:hypothetical protein